MKKSYIVYTLILLGINFRTFAQSNQFSASNAVAMLKNYASEHTIEKAYLHFDHPYAYYLAGETVFFKAYVTMGQLNLPTNISSILNVELLDKKDSLLQIIKLQLINGIGWGDFLLPDNLPRGSYRIRAYTNWMRNDKEPVYFEKYLSVTSTHSSAFVNSVVDKAGKPSLQFFPEGGNLVTDLESRVGFKAIGNNGLGINFKGVILDNTNKEIAQISSSHLGMGMVKLTPENGKSYSANVIFENGYKDVIELPRVENEGITLAINTNDTNKLSIEIKANRTFYKQNLNKGLSLVIYNAGVIKTVNTKLDNSILGLDLPTNNLKTGVVQVTLFAESGEPLCERLVFVKNNNQLKLSLISDKQVYKKREKVFFDFDAKNKEGNSAKGSYSVSVIDESKVLVDENSEITNQSYLLLSSDLKGYIEKPNYYFANNDKNARADLDALMLTQGYRQFVWKEILNAKPSRMQLFNPEKSVNIAGFLKNKVGEPIANNKVILINKSGGTPQEQITDNKGAFNFNDIAFYTGDKFILKTTSSNGKNQVILKLDTAYYGPGKSPISSLGSAYDLSADILAPTLISQPAGSSLISNKNQNLSSEANIPKKIPSDKNEVRSSKLGGSGGADQVIMDSQILPSSTLSASLNGIVRGVYFINGNAYLSGNHKIANNEDVITPMLVVIDGSPGGSIDNIPPDQVESVEILKSANTSIYGMSGGDGVMVINTKQGANYGNTVSFKGFELSPGIFSISPKGIYKAKSFYAPKYDRNTQQSSELDLRTTIFWQPNLVTDDNGKASFNFFNSDGVGNYRVVIEGIDNAGNLGRIIYRYKVVN